MRKVLLLAMLCVLAGCSHYRLLQNLNSLSGHLEFTIYDDHTLLATYKIDTYSIDQPLQITRDNLSVCAIHTALVRPYNVVGQGFDTLLVRGNGYDGDFVCSTKTDYAAELIRRAQTEHKARQEEANRRKKMLNGAIDGNDFMDQVARINQNGLNRASRVTGKSPEQLIEEMHQEEYEMELRELTNQLCTYYDTRTHTYAHYVNCH